MNKRAILHGQSTDRRAALRTDSTKVVQSSLEDMMFFLEGQLCQHIRKIFQDSRGDLWFGTNVYDIMRYDGDSLRYFRESDGFA